MKKYLKKSLSVFLAFLMVLSCFVFAPEMFTFEADAAQAGGYTVTLTFQVDNACDGATSWKITYKPTNGTGSETTTSSLSLDEVKGSEGTATASYTVPGFPTAVFVSMKTPSGTATDVSLQKISINGTNVFYKSDGSADNYTFDPGWWSTTSYTFSQSNYSKYWISPKPTSIEWGQGTSAHSVRVPGGANADSSKTSATFTSASTVLDQYGVAWYQPANYTLYADAERSTALNVNGLTVATTGKASTAPTADFGKVTVSDTAALKNYVAYGTTTAGTGTPATTRTVYAFANFTYSGSTFYSSKYAVITIENPTYKWTFNANGGTFASGSTTEVTQYYGTTLTEEQIPTGVTKTGYTFGGYANNSGTKLTAGSTKFTAATTWYAQWSPIVNKIAFYNYNGQPIAEYNAYYDETIGKYVPANPTRPSTAAASYVFKRWVNWETGEELDPNATLQSTDSAKVLKFIAEYKINDGAGFPTYEYNFYSNSKRIGNGSGNYRSEVEFPANPTKATESKDNGYSYEFAGWIVDNSNYDTATADVIVDTTKGETLEEVVDGKKFLSVDDGDFQYYLKENIKFYPVFIAKYKQVTVTLHYKDVDGNWKTTTTSNENTICQNTFDLGIPNPKSYNTATESFTFNGWTATKNPNPGTTKPTEGLELGDGNSINITLTNNCEYWACYSKSAVEYKAYYYKDGAILDEQKVEYDETFNVATEKDTNKARENMTGYTFKGWSLIAPGVDEDGNAIEQDLVETYNISTSGSLANPTFYAVYESFDYYEVTFLDDEGKELQTGKDYIKNDVLEVPEVADKDDENDAQYTEAFIGWKDSKGVTHKKGEKLIVTGNETYKAVFEKKVRQYLIKFYDVNGQTFDENKVETSTPIATATLDYGTNIQDWIDANWTEGEKLEEKINKTIPENTNQYTYTFNGWSPNLNSETTVTGTATYKANYKVSRVEYKVHWLNTDKTEFALTKYFYQGNIMTPSGKPVCEDLKDYENYPTDKYTWSFLGWYACDENGELKTDSETGEYIKFAKGMKADVLDQYFLARFGYVAKQFAITIYDSDKTTVLETIDGKEADAVVEIALAYTKAPTADKHYIPSSLKYMSDDTQAATFTDSKASYTVGTNNKLYVVYTEEAHNHDDNNWVTTKEPTYGDEGIKENACTVCGYIKIGSIDKYKDDQAPTGIIYIGGYTWSDDTADKSAIAYVKADSLVNIITRDLGSKNDHADLTAGVGIKKIEYAFLTGEELSYTYTEMGVAEKFTVNQNVDISLPTDFAGKYLEVIITDYNGETYTITTNTLQVDSQKPVVEAIYNCEEMYFAIKEDNEIATVLIEKYNEGTKTWTVVDATEYKQIEVGGEDDYKDAYQITSPNGTYKVTVTDKAGNVSTSVTATATGKHELGDYIVTTEATCTSVGYQHKECKNCDYKTDDEEIAMAAHKYPDAGSENEYTIDIEPTCTEKGSKSIHCTVCDEVKKGSTVEVKANGHDEVVKEVEATCEKAGYKLLTCKNCDLWILTTEGYEATGHTADEAKHAHKDATCSEEGYDYDVCSVCEAKFNEKTLEKLQHEYKDATPENVCTGADAEGHFYSVWECEDCHNKVTNYPELAEHDYSVKGDKPVKEASCGQNEVYRYTCSRCDAYKDVETRYTALTHDYEWIVDTAATCTKAGSKHQECKNCHDKKEAVEIAATGHELVKDEANYKDATCGTDGVNAKKCSNEGCTYTESTTIPATGKHNYTVKLEGEGNYLAATCTEAGYQVYQCNGCTQTNTVTIPALGHEHAANDEGTVIKAATCKATGTIEYDCINGDHKYTEEIAVDASAHDTSDGATVVKVVKSATCTEGGKEIRNCKICGGGIEVETKALDHDFTKWVVTEAATCVDDGEEKLVCSRCGIDCTDEDTKTTRPITATGKHSLKTHAKVDAKCTVDGTDTYYECTVCGKLFSDADGKNEITTAPVIKADGHQWGEYITVAATCSADGYKYKVCSVCGDKSERESTGEAALNHEGGTHTLIKVDKAATCKAEGQGVYQCSLCGNTFKKAIAIDENAHSAVWTTVAATCTIEGKRVKKCSTCGKELDTKTIDALGHSYKITTKDVYENGMIYTETTKTCSRCGDEKIEKIPTGEACKVTFAGAASGEITVDKGGKLKKSDLPTIDLTSTREGWAKSVKWTVNGAEVTFPMTVDSNITVTATVTEYELTYTVKFVNTLSKEELSSTTYKYNADVTAPDDLSIPGYTFSGWSVAPSDTTVTVYSKGTIPAATADVTYYAVFTAVAGAKTYYVTFKNTAGTKTYDSQIVTSGADVYAPQNPTKESNTVFHYVFAGWTDKDGSVVTFPMTNVTTNVTVYAKFTEVKHADHKTQISSKDATCTDPAEVTYECTCGYEWIQYTTEPLGHDYQEIGRDDDGGKLTVTYKCSRCEETWTKTVVYNANAGIVIVTVKDTSGNAVEGATVQLYLGDLQTMTAVTDANGQAKFPKYDAETNPNGLKDGNYTVKVTKTGYNTATGTLKVKDGTGSINLSFAKIDCHCICHSSGFFGKIRRFFNKLLRTFSKNYTCCDCGECEVIH